MVFAQQASSAQPSLWLTVGLPSILVLITSASTLGGVRLNATNRRRESDATFRRDTLRTTYANHISSADRYNEALVLFRHQNTHERLDERTTEQMLASRATYLRWRVEAETLGSDTYRKEAQKLEDMFDEFRQSLFGDPVEFGQDDEMPVVLCIKRLQEIARRELVAS